MNGDTNYMNGSNKKMIYNLNLKGPNWINDSFVYLTVLLVHISISVPQANLE